MSCIYSAKYLVSGNAPPVAGGALLAHAGRIVATGTSKELTRANPGVEIIDFADALLVPLLVNAHTHLELTDFPQWAAAAGAGESPDSFVDWILRLIQIKQTLVESQYHVSLNHGIQQSLAAGTGAVGDILSHHALRNLYCGSALMGSLFLETLGQEPGVIRRLREELLAAVKDDVGAVELGISPHSPYTVSKDYLRSVYTHCRQYQLRCTTHLAESPAEVEFVRDGRGDLVSRLYSCIGWECYTPQPSGLRPVEYLQQQGGLFPENLLVHGVQLNGAEIEILAEKQMSLALCPRSNARLKVGKAPAGKLHQAGVKLALGTDSLASCDSLSIWDEMAFAHHWFNGELDAPTLYRMATLGGAEVLGLAGDTGSLDVGKAADFQVLQPETAIKKNDIFDYFVSGTCTADIVQVYHRGKQRV